MRNRRIALTGWFLILAGAGATPSPLAAGDGAYVPPLRGAPESTMSNGVSAGPAPPRITLIALDSVFETAESQPTLFWHIDSVPPRRAEIQFYLVNPSAAEPVVTARLPGPRIAGLQALDLGEFDARLEPEHLYEWSLSLRLDPTAPDADLRQTGFVRYRPRERTLSNRSGNSVYESFSELTRALRDARDAVALTSAIRFVDSVGSLDSVHLIHSHDSVHSADSLDSVPSAESVESVDPPPSAMSAGRPEFAGPARLTND